MARFFLRFGVGLALLAVIGFGITYSWTFTPHGRLDYAAALIAKLAASQDRPLVMTPEARARSNAATRDLLPRFDTPPLASVEDREIPGPGGEPLVVRIYTPDAPGPLPLYLNLHGGGFWMGNEYVFDAPNRSFAAQAEVILVSPDYRLAPQHPYPAAVDDGYATLLWMHANAEALGGDAARIAIGGASAGGNLAAALALRARDQGGPDLAFQYLNVPVTDLVGDEPWPSFAEAGDDYLLKVSQLPVMLEAYVPDPAERSHPYVSPLWATNLRGLPPALIVTAHFDPLRDQGEAYAQKLEAAGVPVTLHREPGAIHGFLGSPERMRRLQAMAARAVSAALRR
ncbi:MAG: alpha/beta hydrolase [Myxococcota bacterium]